MRLPEMRRVDDSLIRATDALITLNSAIGSADCEHCVCDYETPALVLLCL